jgi:hypothetical protein
VKHIWAEEHRYCPALKVPRQWPLFLLVYIHLRQGKALGSVVGERLGSRLFMNRDKNMNWAIRRMVGILILTLGGATCEARSATFNLGTNSAFALGSRKTTENLDRDGRSQNLPEAVRH